MNSCFQSKNVTVLQHGRLVNDFFKKIISGECDSVPKWYLQYKELILLELSKYDADLISLYHIYHDCGKPFCRTNDDLGHHFVNHAKVSADIFEKVFGASIASLWVFHDMDAHLLKAEDIGNFCKIDGYIVLLISALAEINANADMFGGRDSLSFKIKFKHLERRGKAICKHTWGSHARI